MSDEIIRQIVTDFYPEVQGIYIFGSYGTPQQWPDSDVDIAILLPPGQTPKSNHLETGECRLTLEKKLHRTVDLVDLRNVSTVFQKEITTTGRMICCRDQYAVDEFEMLTLSYYQKLNEERKEILEAFYQTGRAYAV